MVQDDSKNDEREATMQITVGTAAVAIPSFGRGRLLIQNLGPGVVYFDTKGSVSVSTGLKLPVGAVYESASPSAGDDVRLIADAANTDVRYVRIG